MKLTVRMTTVAVVAMAVSMTTGCIIERTTTAVRVEKHSVMWPGDDLPYLSNAGDSMGLFIGISDNSSPAMGPLYVGGSYSLMTMNDGSDWHRLGVRMRSSMLDHPSNTYPYAMVGVYGGLLEPEGRPNKLGIGVEGGYGFRTGLGEKLAVDLEVIFEYAYLETAFSILSTRLGGGVLVQF